MAELTAFSFRIGDSLLHRLDVRFKLVFLALISFACLEAYLPGLSILTLTLAAAMIHTRLSFLAVLKEIRYFLILLLFVFTARALSTPGVSVMEVELLGKTITVTSEGLYHGTLICWRLLLTVLLGLLLVTTTRSSEIRAALGWFLAPLPFIPEKRTATMISLTVRFIPLILSQAKETSDAQRARGIENRKNPIYRLTKFAIPLMRRTFENADKLVIAMEARCYTENRTEPELSSGRTDWIVLVAVVCLCILVVVG